MDRMGFYCNYTFYKPCNYNCKISFFVVSGKPTQTSNSESTKTNNQLIFVLRFFLFLISVMKGKNTARLFYIDVIRGWAIVIMVLANSAPYVMQEPYPFWFRLMSSFAAPVFIALSGYMIGLKTNLTSNKKLIVRGLLVVLAAISIDVFIWKLMPFQSYDVLYIIGFSIVLSPLLLKLNRLHTLALMLFIFASAFVFQYVFHYTLRSLDSGFSFENMSIILRSARALILDGWFPVLPWLGFFVAGMYLSRFGIAVRNTNKLLYGCILSLVFAASSVLIYFQYRPLREAYGELFYPADFYYCTAAFSILALLALNARAFRATIFEPVSWLGRSSLFFYILHLAVISYGIASIHELLGANIWLSMAAFFISLSILGWVLQQYKKTRLWQKTPYVFRFLLGS